jgi:hypothetical protein
MTILQTSLYEPATIRRATGVWGDNKILEQRLQ